MAISDFTQVGDVNEKLLVKGPVAGKEIVKEIPVASAVVDRITPMAVAEVMPAFPGGMEGLRKFLQKNLVNQPLLSSKTLGEII